MRLRTLVFVVLIGALVSGAVAWAAIPTSTTGEIVGCHEKNGNLHVIDAEAGAKCKKNETQLVWNQKGEQGEPGHDGDPGTPGAPGISHAYSASAPDLVEVSSPAVEIASVQLPAGDYVVSAKTNAVVTPTGEVSCTLALGELTLDQTAVSIAHLSTIALQATAHLDEVGSVTLYCGAVDDATGDLVGRSSLVAIAVDQLN